MAETGSQKPLIERLKALRPRRAVRRAAVQAVFALLTLALLAEMAGAVLKLAGVALPFGLR